jgi:hypothetical protein
VVIQRIDSWFPFDPCQLEEVGKVMRDFYNEWGKDDVDVMLDRELEKIYARRGTK